jgi:hypothetical protein
MPDTAGHRAEKLTRSEWAHVLIGTAGFAVAMFVTLLLLLLTSGEAHGATVAPLCRAARLATATRSSDGWLRWLAGNATITVSNPRMEG